MVQKMRLLGRLGPIVKGFLSLINEKIVKEDFFF